MPTYRDEAKRMEEFLFHLKKKNSFFKLQIRPGQMFRIHSIPFSFQIAEWCWIKLTRRQLCSPGKLAWEAVSLAMSTTDAKWDVNAEDRPKLETDSEGCANEEALKVQEINETQKRVFQNF